MTESVPKKYQALFERVGTVGAKSKADAIKAFCLNCVGFHSKRVTNCTAPGCPLFQVRPYQSSGVNANGYRSRERSRNSVTKHNLTPTQIPQRNSAL